MSAEPERVIAGVRSEQGLAGGHVQGRHALQRLRRGGGKRSAFVRVPDKKATIIVLTNDDATDAKGIADKLTDQLLFSKK